MSRSTHPAARASKQIFSRLDWIGLGWIGFDGIGLALALFENRAFRFHKERKVHSSCSA